MTSPLTPELVDYAEYWQAQARADMLAILIIILGTLLVAGWRWAS